MGYSENALAFATIGVAEQVRLSDRLSYLYLEHAQIVQGQTGLLALRQGEEGAGVREAIHVPIGSLATIFSAPAHRSLMQQSRRSPTPAQPCYSRVVEVCTRTLQRSL